MKIKLSIRICKPISQVWGVFIDNNSWKNWYGGEIKSVNPQWQNGASIDWAKGEPSKITGFDSHKIVSFKGHNGTITNYYFNEKDNNTTEFSIENDYTISSLSVFNKVQVESQIETDLVSFRDYVELMDNVTLDIVTSNSNENEVSPSNNDFFAKPEIVKDEERLFITANDVYLHSVGFGDLFITITAIYFIHYPEKDKADRETSRICDWGFNLMERVNRHKGSLVFWQADLKSKHSDESGFYITKNHFADNLRYGASLKDIEIGQRDYKFTAIKTSQLRLDSKIC